MSKIALISPVARASRAMHVSGSNCLIGPRKILYEHNPSPHHVFTNPRWFVRRRGAIWLSLDEFYQQRRFVPAFAIVTIATLVAARQTGDAVLAVSSRVQRALPEAPPAVWLFAAVGLGITLRILLAMLFPAIPLGNWNVDMIRYLDLAHKLADGMDYATPEGRAFWAPGLPLALALLLPAFGSSVALAYNIITFVFAEVATFVLGRMLGDWRVGCLAAFFLAVWPNFVFGAPLLNKESLLIALWPTAAFFI